MGYFDVTFDGELHGFDHKITPVWDADRIVVRKKMLGEFIAECSSDVAGD